MSLKAVEKQVRVVGKALDKFDSATVMAFDYGAESELLLIEGAPKAQMARVLRVAHTVSALESTLYKLFDHLCDCKDELEFNAAKEQARAKKTSARS